MSDLRTRSYLIRARLDAHIAQSPVLLLRMPGTLIESVR